jgi:hypothetical protein
MQNLIQERVTRLHVAGELPTKTYTKNADGSVAKTSAANITHAEANSVPVRTAQDLVRLLEDITESTSDVLVPSVWNGDEKTSFQVRTRGAVAALFPDQKDALTSLTRHADGQLYGARVKDSLTNSAWVLLDADNAPGMPVEWCEFDIAQRLELWEKFLPNISKSERVELRSTSSRVSEIGVAAGRKSHAWIRISDPSKLHMLRAFIGVEMTMHGADFASPNRSRSTGEIISSTRKSVFDLAVFDTARIVFCAQPIVKSESLQLHDAGIEIVNPGGGAFDVSNIEMPSLTRQTEYSAATNISTRMSQNGLFVATSQTRLSWGMPVEVNGQTNSLEYWFASMGSADKLRCESPFRASNSQAAFIGKTNSGNPFIYDSGDSTSYYLESPFEAEWIEVDHNGKKHWENEASDVLPIKEEDARRIVSSGFGKIRSSTDFVGRNKPADYTIDGILQRGMVYTLTGYTGHSKSSLTLYMAMCIALGKSFGGRDVEQGAVLFLAGENPDNLRTQWIALCHYHDVDPENPHIYWHEGRFDLAKAGKALRAEAAKIPDLRFVAADTLQAFFIGDNDNDNVAMRDAAMVFRDLTALDGSPTVLIPAHPAGKVADRSNLVPRGGGSFLNEIDGNFSLWNDKEKLIFHTAGKLRGAPFDPIFFKLTDCDDCSALIDTKLRIPHISVVREIGSDEMVNDIERQEELEIGILQMAHGNPFTPKKHYMEELEIGRYQMDILLRKLISQKLVKVTSAGRYRIKLTFLGETLLGEFHEKL